MQKSYKSPFRQFVKKAHRPLRLAIEDEVDRVCENLGIGESKKGNLAGILVHKFKFNRREYLIAYRPTAHDPVPTGIASWFEFLVIDFYKVGTHENFYDELKRYLREG